jgi:hypothetical protein
METITQIKERPVLFSGKMVQAILSGGKTQTRRVVKWRKGTLDPTGAEIKSVYEDGGGNWIGWTFDSPKLAEQTKREYPNGEGFTCPYGKPGDRLWVRETFAEVPCSAGCEKYPPAFDPKKSSMSQPDAPDCGWRFKATWDRSHGRWYPSIHMPRVASRLLLEVVSVRVERLQAISEADALAEGVKPFIPVPGDGEPETAKRAFQHLWDSINGKRLGCEWAANPWVWVVEFRKIEA